MKTLVPVPTVRTCPKCRVKWKPRKPRSVKCPRCWTVLR